MIPVDLVLDLELADRILSGLWRRGYATPVASPDADDRTSDTGLDQWVGGRQMRSPKRLRPQIPRR
jgi:hypothetical protein